MPTSHQRTTSIIAIEGIFVSIYKTTTKIDRESFGKIILSFLGIRDAYFRVIIHFNSIVTLIFSDCGF